MSEQYVSIKEFAEMAGVSSQAVYKRLGSFNCWLKVENGKKVINIKALELFAAGKNSTNSTNLDRSMELLQRTIDLLRDQLDAKDAQIHESNALIGVLMQQNQRLLVETKPAEDVVSKAEYEKLQELYDQEHGQLISAVREKAKSDSRAEKAQARVDELENRNIVQRVLNR